MEGIRLANLSAMILDMILNLKLAKAIGLYWSIEVAFETFGRRAMMLALKPGKIQLVVKNSKTALKTSCLTISQ
jgi:hypothetical protein